MTSIDESTEFDLLVVGSGPAGSAFARELREQRPQARILMIDAGPVLTPERGRNVLNIPLETRKPLQRQAQGPGRDAPTSGTGIVDGAIVARPGTFLLRQNQAGADPQKDMPSAAMSANVGGMGAHWTCACPAPDGSERVPFLGVDAFDEAFRRAHELLGANPDAFPLNQVADRLRERLSGLFDEGRAPERVVQRMPVAAHRSERGGAPEWLGPAAMLHDLAASEASGDFTLSAETVCRRILHENGRAWGAELTHADGSTSTVRAAAVVVACDALRSPQLLHASGLGGPAVGRYLNDQPQMVAAVRLNAELSQNATDERRDNSSLDIRDHFTGVTWVPFADGSHPFHGQILQLDASPILVGEQITDADGIVVMLSWFAQKDIRADDRVAFSDTEVDAYGLPAMTVHYDLTDIDRATIQLGIETLHTIGDALGEFVEASHPRLLPAGSSLHYQGSVRMGAENDGTSVCDPGSRVWGTENVYVAGNGVIPTATACNPTATAAALAVLGARSLATRIAAPEAAKV